jgi:uncharacterized protein with GYD domain
LVGAACACRIACCKLHTANNPGRRDDHADIHRHHELHRSGIRTIKDAPKRAAAARELAKKLGVDIKQLFLTTGDSDLLAIVEAADGAVLAKFCMTIGAAGNLRTKTARAWPEAEYMKMVSELP